MKEIEHYSIGGYAFTMDRAAVAEAEQYIKEISDYYSNQEILDGIEERMAELLRERVATGGVVSKENVLAVIDILGRPERIAENEPEPGREDQPRPARKLYRDMQNAKLAGVCSGLGAYFRIDPVILRIIFTAVTLAGIFWLGDKDGVFVIIAPVAYIILWICIPAARTAQQRWELRGDDGSVESVRRNIENGAAEMGEAIRQVGSSPSWSRIGRILEVIAGVLMLIISVSGIFAGALAAFGWQWLGWTEMVQDIKETLTGDAPWLLGIWNTEWVRVLAIAVYGIPFIGMLYGSIMMLFRIKSPRWRPGLVLFVLWLIALVALMIVIIAGYIPTEIC